MAETYNGYCVKCKEKRDFEGEVKVSDSGRRMAQGTCPVCGTKMNRILGKAEQLLRNGRLPSGGRPFRVSGPEEAGRCPAVDAEGLWTCGSLHKAAVPR